jgi:Protein of unknown function (DUF1360)
MGVETERSSGDGPLDGYAPPPKRPPFGSYALFTGIFNAVFAAGLAAAERTGRLPERPDAGDVVLIGVASHKLSRVITKDKITSFARAPFTEYQSPGGPGEVEERARGGRGLRRAIGELLVCPYCLGLWVSAGMHLGVAYAPRPTRAVASTFTALTIADFLQIAYKAAEEKGLGTDT